MLSLFPQLFDFAVPVTAILRIIIALIFIFEGKRNFTNESFFTCKKTKYIKKTRGVSEIISGFFFLAGFLVQPFSVLLAILAFISIYNECKGKQKDNRIYTYYFLLGIITLSFLFFGPGILSLDFPL